MNETSPSLPIQNLEEFVDETEKLFRNIVEHWSPLLFSESVREDIHQAWLEIAEKIGLLKVMLKEEGIYTRLVEVGLTGKQLRLKFNGLNAAWRKFKSRGTVKLLRELLGWIDLILGSLAEAIPLFEVIKEFKEALEKLLESDGDKGVLGSLI